MHPPVRAHRHWLPRSRRRRRAITTVFSAIACIVLAIGTWAFIEIVDGLDREATREHQLALAERPSAQLARVEPAAPPPPPVEPPRAFERPPTIEPPPVPVPVARTEIPAEPPASEEPAATHMVPEPTPAPVPAAPMPEPSPELAALPPPPLALPPAPTPPRAPTAPSGEPEIAIVIDDVGIMRDAARRLIQSGEPLTLAFLPYARGVAELAGEASAAGLDVLVHMPMQPMGHADPGPGAITRDLPPFEVARRTEAALRAVPGAVGLNNHMGSLITADPATLKPMMAMLAERGLFFLDSRTTPHSRARGLARDAGVTTLSRDVFLDNEASSAAVLAQLATTERVARTKGQAIAIGHPHPETIQAVLSWMHGARERGFRLVTLRELARQEACPGDPADCRAALAAVR